MNNFLPSKYPDVAELHTQYSSAKPLPMIQLKDFLPESLAIDLYNESQSIPNEHWTEFTRNGSHMKECKKLDVAPVAFDFVSYMHSSFVLNWLEQLSGIDGLMPDPYLTGAGYSRSFKGDTLKVHTDFNWNEKLKLHRALSLVVYITPSWQEAWGGALNYYDRNRENVEAVVPCTFNNCVIWNYTDRAFHGYEVPLSCPEDITRNTYRLFYYTSNSSHKREDPPHRSLYWIDPATKQPYDIRTQK
jgi:Rps23 Pro-64 3,4-dihydroxylase Tpa1-like proline 4-hydroxylase